jgi:glutathione S-transferase
MAKPTLTIASKNTGSWSLRAWMLCKLAGLEFDEVQVNPNDPATRAELLLRAPSFRVPSLAIEGVYVWDTLAIGESLNERCPEANLLPTDPKARAHCRSICGEMHSNFSNLRSALPMNIRARYDHFPVWTGAQSDIGRVREIFQKCLETYGGPFLFGEVPTMADAFFAPVVCRFVTYGVELNETQTKYCDAVRSLPAMQEWIEGAGLEPEVIEELDAEF